MRTLSVPKTIEDMRNIKRFLILALAFTVTVGVAPDVQAQSKKKTTRTTKTTKGKKKSSGTAKKETSKAPEAPRDVVLPMNSNDCLFAIPLQIDRPYGPTNAPDGSGRVMEIVADKAHPNLLSASTTRCGTRCPSPTTASW